MLTAEMLPNTQSGLWMRLQGTPNLTKCSRGQKVSWAEEFHKLATECFQSFILGLQRDSELEADLLKLLVNTFRTPLQYCLLRSPLCHVYAYLLATIILSL